MAKNGVCDTCGKDYTSDPSLTLVDLLARECQGCYSKRIGSSPAPASPALPAYLSKVAWKDCDPPEYQVPGLLWATHTGSLEIVPGLKLDCARLSNGMAIITEESRERFMKWMRENRSEEDNHGHSARYHGPRRGLRCRGNSARFRP